MTSSTKITIAVSARALFDFESENQVFREDDPSAYCALQASQLDVPAGPDVAFPLVRELLAFNGDGRNDVEVAILSRNDPVTGLRVFASARHHGLAISRAIFTSGAQPHRYLAPLEANLFLSAHAPDVREAMMAGYAAARVYPVSGLATNRDDGELRIAFDGDSVLFSDEAERVFRPRQLQESNDHEARHARLPLPRSAEAVPLRFVRPSEPVRPAGAYTTGYSSQRTSTRAGDSHVDVVECSELMRQCFLAARTRQAFLQSSGSTYSLTTTYGTASQPPSWWRLGTSHTASITKSG